MLLILIHDESKKFDFVLVWTHAHLTGAINIFETYFILSVWKSYHETLDYCHLSTSDDKYDCIEISLHLRNIDTIKYFICQSWSSFQDMPIQILDKQNNKLV